MEPQQKEDLINQVKQRYNLMADHLSEKDKRLWAASEANTIGRGGDEMAQLNIERAGFHGEWNYRIMPLETMHVG